MKKILIFISLLFTFSIGYSATQLPPMPIHSCDVQTPYGYPTDQKTNTTKICRKAYILEHDNNVKIPVWVSYVLKPENTVGCVMRSNAFEPDQSLPSHSTLKDYDHSGYDIGHQANDGDMSWDPEVERESFILSNMAPQLPGFNRGIWKDLEDQVRAWAANRGHSLLVYVGPIYSQSDRTIGNGVIVPHAFYKIVLDLVTHEAIVTEFPHQPSKANLNTFIVPIEKVEKDTGVDFPLPINVKFSQQMWPSATKSVRKEKATVCSH